VFILERERERERDSCIIAPGSEAPFRYSEGRLEQGENVVLICKGFPGVR
jgi:hypothetical protein